MTSQTKNWCFTVLNFVEADVNLFKALECVYIIFGTEFVVEGTIQLQGFVQFKSNQSLSAVKTIHSTCQWNMAIGNSVQNINDCFKDCNFIQRGNVPIARKRKVGQDQIDYRSKERVSARANKRLRYDADDNEGDNKIEEHSQEEQEEYNRDERTEESRDESYVMEDSKEELRIMFTGIKQEKNLAAQIGAVIVEDPEQATHIIICDCSIKRTLKLMMAINCGVKFVVRIAWLIESVKKGGPISIRLNSSPYIARDREMEKRWSFSFAETLAIARGRGSGSPGVFAGLCIYVMNGVCGNRAPPVEEMIKIVESGGGTWLQDLSISTTVAQKEGVKEKAAPAQNVIVISNRDFETATACERKAALSGPGKGIYTTEIIFLTVMRQKLSFPSHCCY